MSIKKVIKNILCPIQCFRFGVKNRKGFLYIGVRSKLVRAGQMQFGSNVSIMPDNMLVCLNNQSNLIIGDEAEIGMYSRIGCLNYVEIGNNVFTGPHVFIADYNHEYRNIDIPIKNQGNRIDGRLEFADRGGIYIGSDTWIGTNTVISGSIIIGKHCVIGANSVVTHDIPDYCVAAGSPCRIIKKYNFKSGKWENAINDLT